MIILNLGYANEARLELIIMKIKLKDTIKVKRCPEDSLKCLNRDVAKSGLLANSTV